MSNTNATKTVAIIGDNFIVKNLFEKFKRYSKYKVHLYESLDNIDKSCDYIIDGTFNYKYQLDILKYAIEKNIEKVLIINHWKNDYDNFKNVKILQFIVPDVYGNDHISFYRQNSGNNIENEICYCTLICECIRKIHESKIYGCPNTYIFYGTDNVKYINVENLYEPINYMLTNFIKNSYYEVYEEEKSVGLILDTIKEIIDYNGNIIYENTNSINIKTINKLNFKYKTESFQQNIRKIYNYLLVNNERFII
jgi:hypothetical protein